MRAMPQPVASKDLTERPVARSARAAHALAHMPERDPALASLALWCAMRDSSGSATYTSNDVIHIGTSFETLPLREQIGLLGHHVLHIALRHEFRMQSMQQRFGAAFDRIAHNLSADAIINECLNRGGHALPRPAVTLTDLLDKMGIDDADPAQHPLERWDVDRLYMQLREAARHHALTTYYSTTEFLADVFPLDAPLRTDRDANMWQAHLLRASRAGGASGRGIGTALMHLGDAAISQTPWENRLRRLLGKALSHTPQRTYRRPRSAWIAAEAEARRHKGPQPVFEPALQRRGLRPRLVVAVDTSGSVDRDILALFAGEVIGITNKSDAETHLLCFDEDVFAQQKISALNARATFRNLPMRREGGTSFVDVLQKADALGPSLIVVLTDLMGAFGTPPKAPVLWATPHTASITPPFGEVLEMVR